MALITDPLGGRHWKKSYKALRSTGRLGVFGVSVATDSKLPGPLRLLPVVLGTPFFHPLALMNANKSVFGVNLGHLWHEPGLIAGWMATLLKGVAEGWVRPVREISSMAWHGTGPNGNNTKVVGRPPPNERV